MFQLRFDRDSRWSETGDRYIIKLFRDYVFHSVDENTNPVVNLAHVLTNLNKVTFLIHSLWDQHGLTAVPFYC